MALFRVICVNSSSTDQRAANTSGTNFTQIGGGDTEVHYIESTGGIVMDRNDTNGNVETVVPAAFGEFMTATSSETVASTGWNSNVRTQIELHLGGDKWITVLSSDQVSGVNADTFGGRG